MSDLWCLIYVLCLYHINSTVFIRTSTHYVYLDTRYENCLHASTVILIFRSMHQNCLLHSAKIEVEELHSISRTLTVCHHQGIRASRQCHDQEGFNLLPFSIILHSEPLISAVSLGSISQHNSAELPPSATTHIMQDMHVHFTGIRYLMVINLINFAKAFLLYMYSVHLLYIWSGKPLENCFHVYN